jgi:hypothetical protein
LRLSSGNYHTVFATFLNWKGPETENEIRIYDGSPAQFWIATLQFKKFNLLKPMTREMIGFEKYEISPIEWAPLHELLESLVARMNTSTINLEGPWEPDNLDLQLGS